MEGLQFFIFCFSFLSLFSNISVAVDTIVPNQTISDSQTLVSSGSQSFELGFFSPGNSKNIYLGIWFKSISPKTVIWVANRDNPLTDSSGVLRIDVNGNIVLLNRTESVVWSSNSSKAAKNPVAQLLDTGNLVLRDASTDNSDSYLWQSFDYPSDTLIPGMKLGRNLETGRNWYLTSWTTIEDPSLGDFSYRLDIGGLPQLVLRKGGDTGVVEYRSGPWDGTRFGYGPQLKRNSVFNPMFISNESEVYYAFESNNNSVFMRFVVNQSGLLEYHVWNDERLDWVNIITLQQDSCDDYGMCGAYSICNINDSPACKCLTGFTPKSPVDWNLLDRSGGCVRRTPSVCQMGEGFKKLTGLKLPDDSQFWVNRSVSREECEVECLKNCSCKAYAQTEVMGCVMWFNDLTDIRLYREGGQDLYLRLAASELDSSNRKRVAIIVVLSLVSGLFILGSISWFIIRKKRKKTNQRDKERPEEDLESPLVDLVTIAAATNNFSYANKIGEGGFGPVYKGELSTGQEIAVKRLSKDSGQGLNEFKNEVILISKLQHRNLVKLLGCCIQGEERMLIYEYMHNKSLDLFIFGQTKGTSLDWQKRFNIIIGIAQGLLYLHRDSRLRIIHRDLKASNILLDNEMNPKISDFGVARIFGGDQTEASTKRVIGTYGYMPPEYAIDGFFSAKSDVFSFGVLVLEIVSGKKNRGFYHHEHELNLLGHAWKLWNDGQALELVDVLMEQPYAVSEVLRCIQVGLLCVQQRPDDRPAMSAVVLMLCSEATMLPQPNRPGFFTERFLAENDSSSTEKISSTANDSTVTLLDGR